MRKTQFTADQAKQIFNILVEFSKAPKSMEDAFVQELIGESPTGEWRFQGALGFGGKFYPREMRVSMYSEDETPETVQMVNQTNMALTALNNFGF